MFKKFSFVTLVLWIIGWLIAYLVILPPINPQSLAFWLFFGPAAILPVYILLQVKALKNGLKRGRALWPSAILLILVLAGVIGHFVNQPMLSAERYAKRINVISSSFEDEIAEVDFDNLPLLDKASSQKVGDRVVGQIADLVSQFSVSDEYSLINYRGSIVRVTPLDHNGFYKYLSNRDGTAGYVIVDTTTGEAKLVETKEGIKYLDSAYLWHNLHFHVQLLNPFSILGDYSFELDEEGNPYWVIQTLKYGWIETRKAVSGVIVCDAITGKMQKYKVGDVPAWIDNVYDANLVIEEINSWGTYQGGYINSQITQKNVVQATDGYTYITSNDDVYMYTGITSISTDESNIGFMMVNLRTHQANYYAVPGAEEYSAMDSAIGAVQEKNYTSTFPLLINLNGRPTYLLSLKDSAQLVKMYAFVDVENYQKVSVSDASYGIKYAAEQYLKMMNGGQPIDDDKNRDYTEAVISVSSVSSVIVSGNTVYLLQTSYNEVYQVMASVDLNVVPFIKEGDILQIQYYIKNNDRIIVSVKPVNLTPPADQSGQPTEGESQQQDQEVELTDNSDGL